MSRSSISMTRLLTVASSLVDFEGAPALHRPDERHLVGIFEIAAHRDAARDPGYRAHVTGQALSEVHRRRLALERGVGCQHDLLIWFARPRALGGLVEELAHLESVGADAIHGRD